MNSDVAVRPVRVGLRRPPATRSGVAVRIVRGLLLGALVAAVVVAGRGSGLLLGTTGLAVAVLLVLLVPTSRELSRRILFAGCLALGWTPFLWWWPLPVGATGRVTIELALLGGALAAWVGAAVRPGVRLRQLIPRIRPVDLLVPLSVVVAVVVLAPLLRARSAVQTLGVLLGGYDNSAHFSMVHMIRTRGVTVDGLGPLPSGATWQFDSYPQGFHTVVATIVELVAGPVSGDIGSELINYSRAVALFVVAVVGLLVAGFCALPALRSRPGLASPVAALVTAVLVFGPGAHAIQGGIGNFTQACVLVVAVALLAVPLTRVCRPLPLAALGGAVVGVATSWVLLLAMAAPALLIALLPLRRRRWSASPLQYTICAVVVVAVLGALARTAAVLSRVRAESPLTLTGGAVPLDIGQAIAASVGTIGVCLLLRRGHVGGGARVRAAALLAVPVVGLATAAALAIVQIRANGSISYYGFKFLIGLEIVMLVLLMVPLAQVLAERRRVGGRMRGWIGSAAVALALTQVFGLTVPDLTGRGLPPGAEGLKNRAQQIRVLLDPPVSADLVERAGPTPAYFLDVGSGGTVDPVLAAQWYLALTDTWTAEANSIVSSIVLSPDPLADGSAVDSARRLLAADPAGVVAVRAEYLSRLVTELDSPALSRRIIAI